jgi:hypothetical protein
MDIEVETRNVGNPGAPGRVETDGELGRFSKKATGFRLQED